MTRLDRHRRETLIRTLRAEGRTLAYIGRGSGITRQAVHDFLRRMDAQPGRAYRLLDRTKSQK